MPTTTTSTDPRELDFAANLLPPKAVIQQRLLTACAEVRFLKKLLQIADELPDKPAPPLVIPKHPAS